MALRLLHEQLEAIRRHAGSDYPAECCGMLLGLMDGEFKQVAEIVPLANLRHNQELAQEIVPLLDPGRESELNRYLVDPRQQLKVEKQARARGLTVLGYYHSHPDHPARPSEYDREHAWPWYSYIIVSVAAGSARDVQSWVLTDDGSRFEPEPIELREQATGPSKAGAGFATGSTTLQER